MDKISEGSADAGVLDTPVGWIGAGKMGSPMIRNLLNAGVSVSVVEPSSEALSAVVSAGAAEAPSISELSKTPVVFSTLPNDKVLLDVTTGTSTSKGLVDILSKGSVFVDMSTVSPECSEKVAQALEKAGIYYLRAPISGSTSLAEQAALTIFASGDETAWKIALPFIEMTSSKHFFLGPGDQARYMKLVVNALVGATSAILAEALALGESGGLDRASMMEVICQSAVASPLLAYKKDTVIEGKYDPAFSVNQMIKDFTLINDASRANGIPLLTTGLILELYKAAANAGLREKDFFALVKWHGELSKQ